MEIGIYQKIKRYTGEPEILKIINRNRICTKTGEIRSITLTLCESVYKSKEWNIENIEPIKGVPVLSVDRQQNETYIDEKGILNVYITDKTVYIQFSAHEIESLIENNHVLFCLDCDDNICGVIINDVGDNEINILEEALK